MTYRELMNAIRRMPSKHLDYPVSTRLRELDEEDFFITKWHNKSKTVDIEYAF